MIDKGMTFEDTVRANKPQTTEKKPTKKIFGSPLGLTKESSMKILLMLQECRILEIKGSTTYENCPDLAWLNIYCELMNRSYRKNNPIIIEKE